MSSWLVEYLAALETRDGVEQANKATINAYTKLADRTAAIQRIGAAEYSSPLQPDSPTQPSGKSKGRPSTPAENLKSGSAASLLELNRLRVDLSTAQKSKASLEAQLVSITAELAALKANYASDGKASLLVARQKMTLERKLKDRELELREKARLVESVQDEMVGLQLELNIAEERVKKVKGENQELVDRWMKKVGKEAEEMNEEYSWK